MDLKLLITMVVPIATVVAAIIAGIFAWMGHVASRRNAILAADISRKNAELEAQLAATVKLVEFRQRWIDALREDMSKFQAVGILPTKEPILRQEFYELGTRIELRMNPNDQDFVPLQNAMYAFFGAQSYEKKLAANAPYVAVCQRILKREWDVLKDELRKLEPAASR